MITGTDTTTVVGVVSIEQSVLGDAPNNFDMIPLSVTDLSIHNNQSSDVISPVTVIAQAITPAAFDMTAFDENSKVTINSYRTGQVEVRPQLAVTEVASNFDLVAFNVSNKVTIVGVSAAAMVPIATISDSVFTKIEYSDPIQYWN